jgi:hypothetical protein
MIEKIREGRKHWLRFKEIEPGHRFQTRYHLRRQRRERGETSRYERTFNLISGPALIIAGFVFLPTPGPSYIIIVIGLWMLSGELLPLARFFDWSAVRLRKLGQQIGELRRSSTAGRALIFAVSLLLATALGYVAYSLTFG